MSLSASAFGTVPPWWDNISRLPEEIGRSDPQAADALMRARRELVCHKVDPRTVELGAQQKSTQNAFELRPLCGVRGRDTKNTPRHIALDTRNK